MSAMSETGASRTAAAVLRAAGGRTALLRMPAPAVSGDDGEQLGLATPGFQDVPLGPVAFQRLTPVQVEMLVSAGAMLRAAGTESFDAVDGLLRGAVGVVLDEGTWTITGVRTMQAEGKPYCYGVTLRKPE